MIGICGMAYQKNWFNVHTIVNRTRQEKIVNTTKVDLSIKDSKRQKIRQSIMRQTQDGLIKQGFVSIPELAILQPIFNDAYSEKGLKAGANYANRSENDPEGKIIPKMGQGNYGLASHNFDDGMTGFSGLQQNYQRNEPYLVNGKTYDNDWLNDKPIYMANSQGVYEYRIEIQKLVDKNDVDILNNTKDPQVTIITCLFPDTNYRIITIGKLTHSYTWDNAPDDIVNYFNLEKQQTNAHTDWYNPGEEEGVN